MSIKTTIAAAVTGLMVIALPMAYADTTAVPPAAGPMQPAGNWHHHDEGRMMEKVLGLTDDQTKQLKDIQQKQKEAAKAAFQQIKTNREAFSAEIVKAAPDMTKVNDLQTQFKTLQGQMTDNHLNSLLEVKKVLSPEQFAGFMALKKEHMMKKRMMMRHGFHKGGFDKGRDGHKGWMNKDKDDDGAE